MTDPMISELEEFATEVAELELALGEFARAASGQPASVEAIVLGDRLCRRAYNITARLLRAAKGLPQRQ